MAAEEKKEESLGRDRHRVALVVEKMQLYICKGIMYVHICKR
jgi:hypothetical protein